LIGDAPAIVVQLKLLFGLDERSFGLENSSSDAVAELIDGLVSRMRTIRLKSHPREPTSVRHERNLLHRGVHVVVVCKLGSWQELILFVACENTDKLLVDVDKHGICPPMKSSLFRIFMTRHIPGYAPEASVLRFPSSWQGRNH
jgi:hypothetical protein